MIDNLIKVKAGDIVKTNQGEFTVTNVMKLLNPFTLMEEIGIMIDWNGVERKIVNEDIIEVVNKDIIKVFEK
jgi:hypothetical protein